MPPAFLRFCPAGTFEDPAGLPDPVGHIFDPSRVADVRDSLPEVDGFWRSELAATGWMLPRLLGL